MKNSAIITPTSGGRFSYEDNQHDIGAGNFFKPTPHHQPQQGYTSSSGRMVSGQSRDHRGSLSPGLNTLNNYGNGTTHVNQHQNRPVSYKEQPSYTSSSSATNLHLSSTAIQKT
jgi:hypothetical protein